jgi:uncharacterized membrane protein (UPF0182 family)
MKNKKAKIIGIVIAAVAVVIVALLLLNDFYVDYLWFQELGFLQIFFKELVTKVQLGIPTFFIIGILVYLYLYFLRRSTKKHVVVVSIGKSEKREVLLSVLISVVFALLGTVIITSNLWYNWLEFNNATEFGMTDPVFGLDISFFIFRLPFLQGLYSVLISLCVLLLMLTVVYTVYLFIRGRGYQSFRTVDTKAAGEEIKSIFSRFFNMASVEVGYILAALLLVLGLGYMLSIYSLVYSSGGIVYGATYSDVNVSLNMYYGLIAVCIAGAVIFVIAGYRKKLKMFLLPPAAILAVMLIGNGAYFIVESYVVAPNEYSKEEPYIQSNITMTQNAYGIDDVETVVFDTDQEITLEDLQENEVTINNIPINDARPTLDIYNSLQGIRTYYEFLGVDVDRYYLDGDYTQMFLSSREMNNDQLSTQALTWVNQHLKYTHGFGVVGSPVNEVTSQGQPELILKNIPPVAEYEILDIEESRIYFGESSDDYVIVGGDIKEFDYPQGDANTENTYDGTAGIEMTLLNKVAFSLHFSTTEIFFSNEVTEDTEILINRNITERVQKIAPFLSYDSDAYLIVSEGRLYWIIDAFTTSNMYPYSQPYGEDGSINYIRNSVKVVVDAYNGDVTFYQVEDDPILETYEKIYPGFITPLEEMPESIKEHLRYSQAMFDIQSEMYETYHMSNTQVFYNREDEWSLAQQFYSIDTEAENVSSSYIIMKLPDREKEEFMLTVAFTPVNKDNMVAWLAGVSDGDGYGDLIQYQFSKQELVYGPMQIEQRIDQDTTISPELTLLGQEGSEVLRGNLLSIPIGNSLLYVEPVYVQATGGEKNLPELQKVIVSDGNNLVMRDTLDEALQVLFSYESSDTGTDDGASDDSGDSSVTQEQEDLITEANSLFEKAQEAQQSGDWAAYGEYLDQLEEVLSQMESEIE